MTVNITSARQLGIWTPDDPEWHQARATRLGGSSIAAVIRATAPEWESRFSLWHRMQALAPSQRVNTAMEWGHLLEPVIIAKYASDHPELTISPPAGTWVSHANDWQLANPDRLFTDADGQTVILEAKTSRFGDGWGEPGTGEVPVYYAAQATWYGDVLGLDRVHLAVLVLSNLEIQEYVVDVDPDVARMLRDAGGEFLRTIRDGERPPIDDSEPTHDVVRALHPDIEDTEVEIPARLGLAYLASREAYDVALAEKRLRASLVLDAIGNGRRAVLTDGRRIAIRVPGRGDNPPSLRAQPQPKPPVPLREALAA